MKVMDLSPKKILFVLLFTALVLIGGQINFSQLLGGDENQFFTFFQFFGPIAGGILGSAIGAVSVLLAEIINFVFAGNEISLVNIGRLLPMVFAAIYFGSDSAKKLSAIIPIVAMALFIVHPVGAQVWYYAVVFWSIPLIVKFFAPKNLFFRSLGATLTAHSVGGVLWIYAFNTTPELWNFLFFSGTVVFERLLFAIGISVSFVLMTTFLARVEHLLPTGTVSLDKKYDLSRVFASRA